MVAPNFARHGAPSTLPLQSARLTFCEQGAPMRVNRTEFKDRSQFQAQVIVVARRLFVVNGYDATSMDDVAKEMQVSKPTIYEFYGSKSAILEAVVEGAVHDLELAWLETSYSGNISFAEFMDQLAGQAMKISGDPGRLEALHLLMREGSKVQGLVALFIDKVWKAAGNAWVAVLSRAMDRGECRRMDLRIAKRLMVAPFFMAVFEKGVLGNYPSDPMVMPAFFNEYFSYLKDGLVLKPGEDFVGPEGSTVKTTLRLVD
jgi:AcrR family transcriptional regulator